MSPAKKIFGQMLPSVLILLCVSAVLLPASSLAEVGPKWRLESLANTTVDPGSDLSFAVGFRNAGDAALEGPYTLVATLPDGMTATTAVVVHAQQSTYDCTDGGGNPVTGSQIVRCENETLNPKRTDVPALAVAVAPDAAGTLTAGFEVSGGGADSVSIVGPTRIAPPPPFGIDAFDLAVKDPSGAVSTQAAAHPALLSTTIDFNTVHNPETVIKGDFWPVEPPKDIYVDLPPGLLGSTADIPRCSLTELTNGVGAEGRPLCTPGSQVGTVFVRNHFSDPLPGYFSQNN